MNEAHLMALGLALAWLAGVRVYLTVLGVGIAHWAGWTELPAALQWCSSPWVMGVAGVLTAVEFAGDKIAGVDSVWDLLQTVARVPAGAFLAAGALAPEGGDLSAGWLAAGGGAALLSHGLKSGTRALVNLSPEPASNALVSTGEDVLALGALGLVFAYPWLALGLLVACSVLAAAVAWWVVRWLRRRIAAPRRSPGAV